MSSSPPSTTYVIPEQVSQKIEEIRGSGRRVAVLTCGLSGSGKSTLSRNLTHLREPCTRLSIDALVLQSHGTYESRTWTPEQIEKYQDTAESILMVHLTSLLRQGTSDIVLDLSFYSKQWRDEIRELIENEGRGRYKALLVVFRGEVEVLWKRIEKRNVFFEASEEERQDLEGLPVTREMLRRYYEGFEWPDGEGEVTLRVV